ncbi:riboflavin synthase [Candidatus Aerophobetes bacterium]|nr:riboflavin synthase [Candidatus Aerophobetes bacterium]
MFTGIVEEIGKITKVMTSPIFQLIIEAEKATQTLDVSDSICTNGVCLTVTRKKGTSFEVQIMPHTLQKTNLGALKAGDKVNLERALLTNSFLGGHFVTGDIDGLARLEKVKRETSQWTLTLRAPFNLKKYIVSQGRVTLEGVSLAVARKEKDTFAVCLIPHTLNNTTLSHHREGDLLNLEVDILAKYVGEIITSEERKGINLDLLKMAGY